MVEIEDVEDMVEIEDGEESLIMKRYRFSNRR